MYAQEKENLRSVGKISIDILQNRSHKVKQKLDKTPSSVPSKWEPREHPTSSQSDEGFGSSSSRFTPCNSYQVLVLFEIFV